jgi:lipopolysaccharide transport system ATP-binding protein
VSDKNIILKAENISKQYRLGTVGTGTLSHDLNRWWYKIRGKEDPYLKVGEVNDRTSKGTSDYVWAIKDINFEVQRGEVLGIIGKNGAGKSTLLKILSKVTSPTTGVIKSRGRIASLLEVGTGFNPELTGRENIYLNGAILGMTKKEIDAKLDEIIEFSGCERYIDTPTKRYSSGMTVRLGFAVAAFLEPEILVVDEVLAVGDAEFQKKAIGKMQDISREGGRTVLFVSHNMAAVKSLCTRTIILENGMVSFEGDVEQGVKHYLETSERITSAEYINTNENAQINSVKIHDGIGKSIVVTGGSLVFDIELSEEIKEYSSLHIGVFDANDEKVTHLTSEYYDNGINFNRKKFKCTIVKNPLVEATYYINVLLKINKERAEYLKKCIVFNVLNGDFYENDKLSNAVSSKVLLEQKWE